MKKIFVVCLLLAIVFNRESKVLAMDKNANYDYYTAGVVEYGNSEINRDKEPEQYIRENIKAYLHFIDLAKEKNVDILVFPEATLNYFSTKSLMIQQGFLIPNPAEKIAPWEKEGYSEHIKSISKKCKEKQIYVLVNLVEKAPCSTPSTCKTPSKLYNTNVVFDRQGRIISRYRKYNLFNEPLVDKPSIAEHSTFTTDFGVKFGHFICFDILFQEPAMSLMQQENITNFLYPSMWFSDLPLLTSDQIHQAWAYANNINLLSSGANNPENGCSGSGIFVGRHTISQIFLSPYPTQKLLTATVPKDPQKFIQEQQNQNQKRFTPVEMQNLHLTEYWAENQVSAANILDESQTICVNGDDICCTFDIKMKIKEIPPRKVAYKYKLLANYTTKMYSMDRECGEIYCAIVACKNDNPKSCGRRFKINSNLFNANEFEKIEITAKIRYNNPTDLLIVPSTLDTSILPLNIDKYSFDATKTGQLKNSFKEFKMRSEDKIKDLLIFGIYGRNFAMDRVIPVKNE